MQWLGPCLVEGSSKGICIPDALRLQQSSPWHDDETGFPNIQCPCIGRLACVPSWCTKLQYLQYLMSNRVLQSSVHVHEAPIVASARPTLKFNFLPCTPLDRLERRLVASGFGRVDEPPVEYVLRRGFIKPAQFVTFQANAFPQSFACLQGVCAMQLSAKLDFFYRFCRFLCAGIDSNRL